MKFGINLLISSLIIFKTLLFFFNYNLFATGFANDTLIWYRNDGSTTPVMIPIDSLLKNRTIKPQVSCMTVNFQDGSVSNALVANYQTRSCIPVFLQVVKLADILTQQGCLRFNAKNAKKYQICVAQNHLMFAVEPIENKQPKMVWKRADELSVGSFLLCFDDFYKNKQKPVPLREMLAVVVDTRSDSSKIVFTDLSITNQHNYLVTPLGILVHNFEVLQAVAPALGGYVSIAFGSGLGPICTGFGPIGGILGLGVGTVIAYQLYQKNKQSRQPKQTPIQHPTPAGGSPGGGGGPNWKELGIGTATFFSAYSGGKECFTDIKNFIQQTFSNKNNNK